MPRPAIAASRVSSLGWFVELPERAGSFVERCGTGTRSIETKAALAQAYVYLFDAERLRPLLDELRGAGPRFSLLADALDVDDAVRRGELTRARELLGRFAGAPRPSRAWAGLRLVDVLERTGNVADAEEALRDHRWDRGDEPPLLRSLIEARLRFRRGEVRAAASILERAASIDDAPPPLAATFRRTLAVYLGLCGDLPRAITNHRLALEAFRELGDRYMVAKEYLSLGQSYHDGDELDHAEFFLRKAGEVIEQLDNPQLEALLVSRRGMLAFVRGEVQAARTLFERDLALCTRVGFRHGQGFARRNLAKALLRLGDVVPARALLAEAVEDFAAQADPFNQTLTRLEQASAALSEPGSPDREAVRGMLDDVARFFERVSRPEFLPQVEAVRTRLLVEEGKHELAQSQMAVAGRALLAQRRPDRLVELLVPFAESCARKGARQAAIEHLAWAYRESVKASRPWLSTLVLDRLGAIDERAVMDVAGVTSAAAVGEHPDEPEQFERFLLASRSAAAREVVREARRVAPTDETVLIDGETGVGKGVLARFVHASSRRAEAPFVALNCGAIAESLLESELFGHEKGAFTGADARRLGVFEAADSGTVFLDEVGELSPHAQVTLLRFLEDRQVRPVGSTTSRRVDVRILAATNRDLLADVRERRFREDLYFRLAVYPIRVPPLRERLGDIPALVAFILARNAQAQEKGIQGASAGALRALAKHRWSGNLRELDNVLRAAVIRCDGKQILERDLPPSLGEVQLDAAHFETLAEVTERHIAAALKLAGDNQSRAAALLGVHRNTLGTRVRAGRHGAGRRQRG